MKEPLFHDCRTSTIDTAWYESFVHGNSAIDSFCIRFKTDHVILFRETVDEVGHVTLTPVQQPIWSPLHLRHS